MSSKTRAESIKIVTNNKKKKKEKTKELSENVDYSMRLTNTRKTMIVDCANRSKIAREN